MAACADIDGAIALVWGDRLVWLSMAIKVTTAAAAVNQWTPATPGRGAIFVAFGEVIMCAVVSPHQDA